MICSDSRHAVPFPTEISVTLSGEYTVPDGEDRAVDIFVFNDDRLQRLDSYQRTVLKDEKVHFAASQKGRKIILAVMNPQTDSYDWSHINSFQSFKNEKADLKKERPSGLLMSGFCAAELAAADSLASADRKSRFFLVDIDEVMNTDPDTAYALFGKFDLTVMPYITETDRKGLVIRKYVSLTL